MDDTIHCISQWYSSPNYRVMVFGTPLLVGYTVLNMINYQAEIESLRIGVYFNRWKIILNWFFSGRLRLIIGSITNDMLRSSEIFITKKPMLGNFPHHYRTYVKSFRTG